MKKSLLCTVSVALITAAAGNALAVDPMGAEMIPSLPGGMSTVGYGVNDNGMVVGQADNANGELVAFAYAMGVIEELPLLPGGGNAQAQGVNNNGVVVGICSNSNGVSRAVKWTKVEGTWTITDLGTLRADGTGFGVAQRINNAGAVVGYSTRQGGNSYHGTIWNPDGSTVDLGTLGFGGNFSYSQGLGINQAGDVSGYAYATGWGPEHGMYVPVGGHSQDITPPGQFSLAQWHQVNDDGKLGGYVSSSATGGQFRPATRTEADGIVLAPMLNGLEGGYGYDINNGSVLVGVMFHLEEDPSLSVFRAFKFESGETTDLNTIATGLVGEMYEARSVSNTGLIVGTSDSGLGATSAVLLYPLPPACAADIGSQGGVPGADGSLDNNDFVVFIDYFFNQDSHADVGVQGGVPGHDHTFDNNDFVVFIDQFFAGCN
jgi:probable HAF family extracellular repeat protein